MDVFSSQLVYLEKSVERKNASMMVEMVYISMKQKTKKINFLMFLSILSVIKPRLGSEFSRMFPC